MAEPKPVASKDIEITYVTFTVEINIPAHMLICPECKVLDIHTTLSGYKGISAKFRCSKDHEWERSLEEN